MGDRFFDITIWVTVAIAVVFSVLWISAVCYKGQKHTTTSEHQAQTDTTKQQEQPKPILVFVWINGILVPFYQ